MRSLQTSRTRPFEILIVDNASGDGSADKLRGSLERVRVVESPTNAGFPGGCNIGIRAALAAGAEYILLLNSDAVLAPDAIGHMAAAMAADPSLGITAPVLLSREEPDHVSSAGISFSRRTARMRHRAAGRRVPALEPGTVQIVDAVSGCVMLIRRAVFERAGLVRRGVLLLVRGRRFLPARAGRRVHDLCVPDALAYHEGGRTIGRRSARRVYFATRNHLRLAARLDAPRGRSLRAGPSSALNAAYVLTSPDAPLLSGLAAVVRGAWHHFARPLWARPGSRSSRRSRSSSASSSTSRSICWPLPRDHDREVERDDEDEEDQDEDAGRRADSGRRARGRRGAVHRATARSRAAPSRTGTRSASTPRSACGGAPAPAPAPAARR